MRKPDRLESGFAVLLVLIGSYETISRHFFGAPTIWAYDSLCMAGGALYLIGASYTYLHNSHTRVDIIYSQLSEHKQALMDDNMFANIVFPIDDSDVKNGDRMVNKGNKSK